MPGQRDYGINGNNGKTEKKIFRLFRYFRLFRNLSPRMLKNEDPSDSNSKAGIRRVLSLTASVYRSP